MVFNKEALKTHFYTFLEQATFYFMKWNSKPSLKFYFLNSLSNRTTSFNRTNAGYLGLLLIVCYRTQSRNNFPSVLLNSCLSPPPVIKDKLTEKKLSSLACVPHTGQRPRKTNSPKGAKLPLKIPSAAEDKRRTLGEGRGSQ